MNKLFFLSITITLFANSYESGKIDMHGGNESYGLTQKSGGFHKSFAPISKLLDKNTSKSEPSILK